MGIRKRPENGGRIFGVPQRHSRRNDGTPEDQRVVSTVGVGGSFSAAFLIDYLSEKLLAVCMEKVARISGFVVAHTEAMPEYPVSFA